ncbi:MAG: hypothetical protein LBU32_27190 [Clostridiales bacterium]|jgi:integrase|nr:hypothetical protein [Clostridiales bacterium]
MRRFNFIRADSIEPCKECRATIGSWAEHRFSRLISLDAYCRTNWPNAHELARETLGGWRSKRPSERVDALAARSKPIKHFLRCLRGRRRAELRRPEAPSPRPSACIPHSFTDEELRAFFYACGHIEFQHQNDRRNRRNLQLAMPAPFRFLYSGGIRPAGARQLKRMDIDLEAGVVNIRKTKGASRRCIAPHDSMRELMGRCDEAISQLYPDRECFFPAQNGSFHPNCWVERHFKKLWMQPSDSLAAPYAFRRHCAAAGASQRANEGFDFYGKPARLGKSMGRCELEHAKRYYSLAPAMPSILEDLAGDSLNGIIPEAAPNEES